MTEHRIERQPAVLVHPQDAACTVTQLVIASQGA